MASLKNASETIVHKPLPHDSAEKHVSGGAVYIDDIPEAKDLLHLYIAMSPHANAQIKAMDLSAVRAAKGVALVLTHEDVPGVNDVAPVAGDDPLFANGLVEYAGQSIFAVAATSLKAARTAAAKANITYEELPALLTIEDAMAQEKRIKRWHRAWKIELIEKSNPDWDDLFESLLH